MIDDSAMFTSEIELINEKYQYLIDNADTEAEKKDLKVEMLKEEDVLLRLVHPSPNP
jgi:hypothetical protein